MPTDTKIHYQTALMLHLDDPDRTEIQAGTTVTFQEWRLLFNHLNFNILIWNKNTKCP